MRSGEELGVDVRTTLLAAHALPPEFAGRADDYIDYVCHEMIPAAALVGSPMPWMRTARRSAFTPAQTQRVFAASECASPARQAACGPAVRLAAALPRPRRRMRSSADHLEYTNAAGVAAMSAAGTVAVLLPGAYYALHETHQPPIATFRAQGVPMAISTDCNPGTSPATSLLLMLNMACALFRLTPEEALAGASVHAARALGIGRPRHACRGTTCRHCRVGHRGACRTGVPDGRQPMRRRDLRRRTVRWDA